MHDRLESRDYGVVEFVGIAGDIIHINQITE